MNIEFRTEFDRETIDALWDQGVNMDDWDYAIICPASVLTEEKYTENESEWEYFHFVKEEDRHWGRTDCDNGSYFLSPPYDKGDFVHRNVEKSRYVCKDYSLDRLLTGCCSNKWYLITWKGKKRAIGIAYHA